MNMGMRSSVRLIAKIDARGGVAGGRWNVKGCGDAKKERSPEKSCPPTASGLPRTKDFGTVLLAARGSDYSGGGVCERGECAMLLGGTLEPRVALALGDDILRELRLLLSPKHQKSLTRA
jgi:hypothetical protein